MVPGKVAYSPVATVGDCKMKERELDIFTSDGRMNPGKLVQKKALERTLVDFNAIASKSFEMIGVNRAMRTEAVARNQTPGLTRMARFWLIVILLAGCAPPPTAERPPWGDEVSRVSSPDRTVDAVLLEENGGATVSFAYSIYLVSIGAKPASADRVAGLYAAGRSDRAYGANLKWQGVDTLRIEFLKARKRRYFNHQAQVNGRRVRILLVDGMSDPDAPPGGMLYNLQGRPFDRS